LEKGNSKNSFNLTSQIVQMLPAEADITRIEYEGPRIAVYTKNPQFLNTHSFVIADIVNTVKKRVVVRTDKSIRKSSEEAQQVISRFIKPEAELQSTFFDDATGEVIIEARRPNLLTVEQGFNTVNLMSETGWKPRIRKAPHIQSSSIQTIYQTMKSTSEEREKFYRDVGENVFREKLTAGGEITLYTLGGFRQVGRSCMLVKTSESKILLDCGIHPGARHPWEAYPRLDWLDIELSEIDAVVLSHAHLDHTGFLPALFKYGYEGPVYCSEPTLPMMNLLLQDFLKIASMDGSKIPYDIKDIRETISKTITLQYGLVTDISPDVKLVLSNAGHILGSSAVHLHIGNGDHNLVYTGDYKFGRSMLFDSAVSNYIRVETLITECTYGLKEDLMPSREEVEFAFADSIGKTLSQGGKVIIPLPAVGRAQEIMLVIDTYMREGRMIEAPVFIEGMISEATAIHVAHPEYLARDLRSKILDEDTNPFVSEYFTMIEHPSQRDEVIRQGPAVILATAGMLEGGPILHYFRELAPDERNKILFVSYQVQGTMGRRVLDGAKDVSVMDDEGKVRAVAVNAAVERIEGFSGHSDYNQIIKFVARLRPKLRRVIVNHGERRKTENLAYAISRIFRLPTIQPDIQEAVRLS
jgi:KH/beta-lactamase-domain protein